MNKMKNDQLRREWFWTNWEFVDWFFVTFVSLMAIAMTVVVVLFASYLHFSATATCAEKAERYSMTELSVFCLEELGLINSFQERDE